MEEGPKTIEEGFDGYWMASVESRCGTDAGEHVLATVVCISGTDVLHKQQPFATLNYESSSTCLLVVKDKDESVRGHLSADGSHISWDDGDLWTRVDANDGLAMAPESQSQAANTTTTSMSVGSSDPEPDENVLAELMARTRPKDATDGLLRGLHAAGKGIVIGVAAAMFIPMAAELWWSQAPRQICGPGHQSVDVLASENADFGSRVGVATGAAFAVAGAACGVVQVSRGLMQAPEARRARLEGKVWDQDIGQWVDFDLCALERRLEDDVEGKPPEANSCVGGQGKVAETELYDLLGVSPQATPSDIKKAYYREALKCHPDKNPGDVQATARFQQLNFAYQVLSDPDARAAYDTKGRSGVNEGKALKVDPVVFFALLFGSQRFTPWTGELHIAMEADHFVKGSDDDRGMYILTGTNKSLRARQLRREVRCACHLREKTACYVYGRDEVGFEAQIRTEAHDLASAQFGPELLITVGNSYLAAAEIYLTSELHGHHSLSSHLASVKHFSCLARHKVQYFRNVADSLQQAQKADTWAEAVPQFLQTAWQYVVQDIDQTMEAVTAKFLQDKSVPWQLRIRRGQALRLLGQIFVSEGTQAPPTRSPGLS